MEKFADLDLIERKYRQDIAKRDFALDHKTRDGNYHTYFEVEVDGIISSKWEIVTQLLVDNVLKF
jgi:hypothetical protein